jgi:hypothetical protein
VRVVHRPPALVAPSARPRLAAMVEGGQEGGYAQRDAVHALQLALDGAADAGSWLGGASDVVAAYGAGAPGAYVSAVVGSVAPSGMGAGDQPPRFRHRAVGTRCSQC